jgi:hypothetical protein
MGIPLEQAKYPLPRMCQYMLSTVAMKASNGSTQQNDHPQIRNAERTRNNLPAHAILAARLSHVDIRASLHLVRTNSAVLKVAPWDGIIESSDDAPSR